MMDNHYISLSGYWKRIDRKIYWPLTQNQRDWAHHEAKIQSPAKALLEVNPKPLRNNKNCMCNS